MLKAIDIVAYAMKWIDQWKQGAALRKEKKLGSFKLELKDVKNEIKSLKNFKTDKDYRRYMYLLKRKRMLEQRIQGMAG